MFLNGWLLSGNWIPPIQNPEQISQKQTKQTQRAVRSKLFDKGSYLNVYTMKACLTVVHWAVKNNVFTSLPPSTAASTETASRSLRSTLLFCLQRQRDRRRNLLASKTALTEKSFYLFSPHTKPEVNISASSAFGKWMRQQVLDTSGIFEMKLMCCALLHCHTIKPLSRQTTANLPCFHLTADTF